VRASEKSVNGPSRSSRIDTAIRGLLVRGGAVSPTGLAPVGMPVLPPWIAVGELALFVLVVATLEWLVPAFDINLVQPNPCWLPVLLLSLQYGTVSGVLAAFVSTAIYVIGGLPEQDVGENHFAYLLRIWGQPMLWIAAAVLLGQFRMRQIAAKIELRRTVAELESQRAAITAYAENLRERCDMLERRIAARPEPAALDILSNLASVRGGDQRSVEATFAEVMRAGFPGSKATLYRREADAFHRIAAAGHPGEAVPADRAPARLAHTHALAHAFELRNAAVTVLTADGEKALAGLGLAAAPARNSAGEVRGLLKLESIEPGQMGPSLAGALQMVADALLPLLDASANAGAASGPVAAATSGEARSWRQLSWFASRRPAATDAPPRPTVKTPAAG